MRWFRSPAGSSKKFVVMAAAQSVCAARSARRSRVVHAEQLESRTLFTAGPTITLTASVPTGSGITGANAQLEFTRDGSTASPIKVYYHATGTLNSHQYTKLSGEVIIHGGETVSYVDIKPDLGLVVATDPALSVVLTQYKAYRRGSPHVATVTINENHGSTPTPPSTPPSTNGEQYSLPLTVNSGSYARTDEPVDNQVNFTSALAAAGGSGALDTDSLRVVETDSSGNVLNNDVPFQFNQASGYDATSNASGDLIVDLAGATGANTNRYFQVQFSTTGSFTAQSFTPQVSMTTGSDSVGEAAYKITDNTATYVVQQSTGGISSILDTSGNDWVGFNSSGGSAGEYRGVPNLGVPSGLHPYDPVGNFPSGAANTATVTVVNSGPLETTLEVTSNDGNESVTYEFYNNFVRATVNSSSNINGNNNSNYWFLYEGTPGGAFSTSDKLVTSDGADQTLDQSYDAPSGIGSGNTATGQWASFQSQNENRFIYFAQDTQDTKEDSYYDLNNQMTVFGFGRTSVANGQQQEETGSNTYTFGIADGNSAAATTINGQYRDVSATAGSATAI